MTSGCLFSRIISWNYHNRAATISVLGFRLRFLGIVAAEILVYSTVALQCLVLPRPNPRRICRGPLVGLQNLQVESLLQTIVQSSVTSDSVNSPVPSQNCPSIYTLPIFLMIEYFSLAYILYQIWKAEMAAYSLLIMASFHHQTRE
jgi:hypothetical protein